MDFDNLINWLKENSDWLLGGGGILGVVTLMKSFWDKTKSNTSQIQKSGNHSINMQSKGNIIVGGRDGTKRTRTKSGNDSVNIQAGTDIIINNGLDISDVEKIANLLYASHAKDLQSIAKETADMRVRELNADFLKKLQQDSSINLNTLSDPDMQYALVSSQIAYARFGTAKLKEILIDILIDRTKCGDNHFQKIVLNECISTAPKLTNTQLDILAVSFLISQMKFPVKTMNDLKAEFKRIKDVFWQHANAERIQYKHIESARCGAIGVGVVFFHGMLEQYPDIFTRALIGDLNNPMDCLVGDRLRAYIQKDKFWKEFDTLWNDSYIRRLDLTSVGIAIAIFYINTKGYHVDLSTWIK